MKAAFAGVLMLGLLSGAVDSCGPMALISAYQEDSFQTTLDVSGPIKLIVDTGRGDIRVTHGQDDKVFVSSRFIVRAPDEEDARELADRIKEDPPIEIEGNTIKLGDLSKYKNGFGVFGWFFNTSISMSFDVQVPYDTEAELDSGSGDQTVSGIRGPVSVDAGSGDVEINGIEKEAVADTSSGHIKVTGAAKVDADAGSGHVMLSEISGDAKIDVGSGDVSLENIGGDIQVDTGSGDIKIDSALGRGIQWRLDTGSGDVLLMLPADARFVIAAETSSGEIEVDFPLTVSGKLRKRELRGAVGESPEAEIRVETSSGDIKIKKK